MECGSDVGDYQPPTGEVEKDSKEGPKDNEYDINFKAPGKEKAINR